MSASHAFPCHSFHFALSKDFSTYFFAACSLYAQQLSDLQKATILASVKTEDGHAIVFRELSSGVLLVTETAKIFQAPLLGHAAFGKSMADIHRMVQPNGKVPDALVAADTRLAALESKSAPTQVLPPPEFPGTRPGPKPYNAGEQDWFRQTFCHDTHGSLSLVNCWQGWDFAHSGWDVGPHFTWYSMVGSEGVAAKLNVYYWNGSSQVLAYSETVSPGTYHWGSLNYYQPFYAHADLDGAGGNTQVSLAVQNCGNGGQWACSLNCLGSISCDPTRSTRCSIVGGNGESFCSAR